MEKCVCHWIWKPHANFFSVFLTATKFGGLSHPNTAPPAARKGVGADLLNSDADKNDYDWYNPSL